MLFLICHFCAACNKQTYSVLCFRHSTFYIPRLIDHHQNAQLSGILPICTKWIAKIYPKRSHFTPAEVSFLCTFVFRCWGNVPSSFSVCTTKCPLTQPKWDLFRPGLTALQRKECLRAWVRPLAEKRLAHHERQRSDLASGVPGLLFLAPSSSPRAMFVLEKKALFCKWIWPEKSFGPCPAWAGESH